MKNLRGGIVDVAVRPAGGRVGRQGGREAGTLGRSGAGGRLVRNARAAAAPINPPRRRRRRLQPSTRRMTSCCADAGGGGARGGCGAPAGAVSKESVQEYYSVVLQSSKDLKTSACTSAARPPAWLRDIFRRIPDEVSAKFYGCGIPIPNGIRNLSVLDLGSGSGRDCFALAELVGPGGRVVGVDMTDEQLAVARAHVGAFCGSLGYAEPNCTFVKGYIEDLAACGLEDGSFDLIVSNCVVNLSPDKPAVLREAYRVLREGGEFHFSDVYCDRRLSASVTRDETLWGECLAGAMYEQDFLRLCRSMGFTDPRVLHRSAELVRNEELEAKLGEAKFFSVTYRLFKMPTGALETLCEDYGQVAVYEGSIPGSESAYQLDDHHRLERGKPMLVCGNTAAMLGEGGASWLAPHFTVTGDRSVHYGLFPCGPAPAAAAASGGAACDAGGGGGCC